MWTYQRRRVLVWVCVFGFIVELWWNMDSVFVSVWKIEAWWCCEQMSFLKVSLCCVCFWGGGSCVCVLCVCVCCVCVYGRYSSVGHCLHACTESLLYFGLWRVTCLFLWVTGYLIHSGFKMCIWGHFWFWLKDVFSWWLRMTNTELENHRRALFTGCEMELQQVRKRSFCHFQF